MIQIHIFQYPWDYKFLSILNYFMEYVIELTGFITNYEGKIQYPR